MLYMSQPSRMYIGDNINVFGRGETLIFNIKCSTCENYYYLYLNSAMFIFLNYFTHTYNY